MDQQWWIPHETEVYLPGRLQKEEGDTKVFSTGHGDVSLPSKDLLDQIQSSSELAGVNDLCTLDSVTFASILHAIRVRYARDEIYTNISRILVAVNPFKALRMYDDQHLEQYLSTKHPGSLAPHIFGVGADLLANFTREGGSQAVLISGESGSGKTESTKLVLLYISQAFGARNGPGAGLQDGVLELNPILEAFGNAKTVRNSNSSRFGKWVQVLVDPVTKRCQNAMVVDYLLEMTRVCSQGPHERNFHIFYQLVQDESGDLDELKLSAGCEGFEYLKANEAEVQGVSDRENFSMLRKSLVGLSFSDDEQDEIFRIVAGILHLGNVAFTDSSDACSVQEGEALAVAAELFGCKPAQLAACMCHKRIAVGSDVTLAPLGHAGACRARDSIAKLIYGRLFKWLVAQCNRAMGRQMDMSSESRTDLYPYVGVLDIAGFESFETNSLEQLFINLSNEKLQQFFNNCVFKSEAKEYEDEGIAICNVEFVDNDEVLQLIEGKGGILPTLDECTFGVKQTDELFTSNVVKVHGGKNGLLMKPKFPNQPFFTISHFAGDVTYTTVGFLEKNAAQHPPEVLELMESSELSVLRTLAVEPEQDKSECRGRPAAKRISVGSVFRRSLAQLVEKLGEAHMHFVRCVKPNTSSLPGTFDSRAVAEQLKFSGVLGALKIRKAGFPFRQLQEAFLKRYIILVPKALRARVLGGAKAAEVDASKASRELLQVLGEMLMSNRASSDYEVGKTKVFLREGLHHTLEMYRRSALVAPALQIQAVWRGHHVRVVMREAKSIYAELRRLAESIGASTASDPSAAEEALGEFDGLVKRAQGLSVRLPRLQEFTKTRTKIATELMIAKSMKECLDSASIDVLEMEAVVARAAANKMQGTLVDALKTRCVAVQQELPLVRSLKASAEAELGGLAALRRCVSDVEAAGLDAPEKWTLPEGPQAFTDAVARLAKLEGEEREARKKAALRAFNQAAMLAETEATKKEEAVEKTKVSFNQWAACVQVLKEERRIKANIEKAVNELNAEELQEALEEAKASGIGEDEVAAAQKSFLSLQNSDFVFEEWSKQRERGESADSCIEHNLSRQFTKLTGESPSSRWTRTSPLPPSLMHKANAGDASVDLRNFSRLRQPDELAVNGPSTEDFLSWSPNRIKDTLTMVEPVHVKQALSNFSNIMRCMGDKPSAYVGNKEDPVLELATHEPALRDEIYVQIMKQLTRNPSVEGASKGWKLFKSLCGRAPPSAALSKYVRAFLQSAQDFVDTSGRLRRQSSFAQAEHRLRSNSFVALLSGFRTERNQLAAEALELFDVTAKQAESSAEVDIGSDQDQQVQDVEVLMEDDTTRLVKVKKGLTIDWLRSHMLAVLGIESGDAFELFAVSPGEACPPWRPLPRTKVAISAATEAAEAGHTLLFGCVNVKASEELQVDDVPNARLTYVHAVRQFMSCRRLPPPSEDAKATYVKIAVALVACDMATYEKKKVGVDAFNAKAERLRAELEAGLEGEGVLERYVPAAWLQIFNRKELAEEVREGLTQLGAVSDGLRGFELMWKSRALSLLQSACPALETYAWGPVTFVSQTDLMEEELHWKGASHDALAQFLEEDASAEYRLYLSHDCIEVIPESDERDAISIPIHLGLESRYLKSWAVVAGSRIAFRFVDFSLAIGLALHVPDGVAEAVDFFLARLWR